MKKLLSLGLVCGLVFAQSFDVNEAFASIQYTQEDTVFGKVHSVIVEDITEEGLTEVIENINGDQYPDMNFVGIYGGPLDPENAAKLEDIDDKYLDKLVGLEIDVKNVNDAFVQVVSKLVSEGRIKNPVELQFINNGVTDEGVAVLAEAIQKSKIQLTGLLLEENQITDEGCMKLIELIENGAVSELLCLSVDGNNISADVLKSLEEACRANLPKLKSLCFGDHRQFFRN